MNVNIGIDIGGFSAQMCVKERGVVMNQSSAWAIQDGRMVACGDEAYALLGREARALHVVYPIRGGVIAREDALDGWLSYLMERAGNTGLVNRPRLLIARAPSMELSQMKRLVAMALDAGASACTLVRSDVCAAIGAGLDASKPRGRLVIDVGAHSVDAALIVMDTVVIRESLPFGMAGVDEAITRMLALRYGMHVGPRTAEALKTSLATAAKGADIAEQVVGLDGASGFPRAILVAAGDVQETILPLLTQVALLAERVVRLSGHDYAEELLEDGIVLVGGGAQVSGLAELIASRAGVPCRVAESPELAVVRGLAAIIERPDSFERLGEAHQTILERRLPGIKR